MILFSISTYGYYELQTIVGQYPFLHLFFESFGYNTLLYKPIAICTVNTRFARKYTIIFLDNKIVSMLEF